MKKLAILVSNAGKGTNPKAIMHAVKEKKINAEILAVISDSSDAPAIIYAKEYNIPIHIIDNKIEQLETLLTKNIPVDYIVLAGWKKIISDQLIAMFPDKILNMHPGLIPDTIHGIVKNPDGTEALWNRGKLTNAAIQEFLDKKVTYAGSTLHFLSKKFDFGKVLGICFEKIEPNDTVDSLYTRLKQKENHMYVDCLAKLCNTINTRTGLSVKSSFRLSY